MVAISARLRIRGDYSWIKGSICFLEDLRGYPEFLTDAAVEDHLHW